MKLNQTLLHKLGEWRPAENKRSSMSISDSESGWAVDITAERNDEMGCKIWELTLRRLVPSSVLLSTWAERCAERVTSLLQRLKVVEIDKVRQEAQLRSLSPTQTGDTVFYDELILTGNHRAVLKRFEAGKALQTPRRQIAFPLPHEALAKLVADLTEAGS
ncbi:MAG: hypothetical protein KatS3mg105_3063 [Gemmatales bacterium]|nr:MAG: hypothetical protein KatS3mg105_3063 [Gemmatales bacterium]